LIEAYNLPVQLRRWFISRLTQEIEKEAEEIEKAKTKNGKSSSRM
jgi:hypothetical protein